MQPYVIKQGDFLALLAYKLDFDANAVWNDPANDDLRSSRSDPNALLATDLLYVPSEPSETLQAHSLAVGSTTTFVSDRPTIQVVVKLLDLAGEAYTADCDGTALDPGSVGGDGTVTFTVPIVSRRITLAFTSPDALYDSIELQVGCLDPVETPSGQRQRLFNLGIPVPSADEDDDDHGLCRAVALFQLSQGMDPSGDPDADTQTALVKVHGS